MAAAPAIRLSGGFWGRWLSNECSLFISLSHFFTLVYTRVPGPAETLSDSVGLQIDTPANYQPLLGQTQVRRKRSLGWTVVEQRN